MKKFIFSFAVVALLFTACSKDDDCSTSDWVGTYSGSLTCEGETDDLEIVITEGTIDGQIILTVDGESETGVIDGCSVKLVEDTGLGVLTAELTLDGNDLAYKISGSVFGESINCSTTLSK